MRVAVFSRCAFRAAASLRSARSGQAERRERRTGSTSEKAHENAAVGAIRSPQVWQVRRLALRLSGVRVVGSVGKGEDEIVRSGSGMVELMPARLRVASHLQVAEDQTEDLRQDAAQWTRRVGFQEDLKGGSRRGHPPQQAYSTRPRRPP